MISEWKLVSLYLHCIRPLMSESSPSLHFLAVYCLCDDANWKPTVALPSFMDAVRDIVGENHCYYAPMKRSGGRATYTGVLSGVLHWTYC